MHALAGVSLFVALQTLRNKRRFQPPMTTWYAAMLFAIVPLRNALPDAPPIGSWIDVTVTLWVVAASVALPAPHPTCSGDIVGQRDDPVACAPTMAAPVGVTSSKSIPASYVVRPSRHSTVLPCARHRTVRRGEPS